MNRRRALWLGLALIPAFPALAQSDNLRRIGYLTVGIRPPTLDSNPYKAFISELRELGYVEGRNFRMDWVFATATDVQKVATDLAARKPAIIVTRGTLATEVAHRVAPATPIVATIAVDLVGAGLAKSMAKPAGQVTGLVNANIDIAGKQIELLREILPGLKTVGILLNPRNPGHGGMLNEYRRVAAPVNIAVVSLDLAVANQIEHVLAEAERARVQAIVVPGDSMYFDNRRNFADAVLKFKIPSINLVPENVEAGGLISYGPSLSANFRRAAAYVDKILRGAKAGDLPIEQPSTLELGINLKTAKALGVAIPKAILFRADRVIE